MLRFLLRRLLQMIPVLFAVVTVTFFLVRLAPGGPFSAEKSAPPEIQKKIAAHYGLDRPLLEQYTQYLARLLHGDLGPSFKYANRRVSQVIATAFPVSLELGCWALLLAVGFGVPAGVLAAARRDTAFDRALQSLALTGICVPAFVLGPLLVLGLGLKTGWFNPVGWETPRDRVLPALTLGAYYAAYLAQLTRAGMIEVLGQDFVRAARAKGVSPARTLLGHALRNGLRPAVSYLGPAAAGLFAGSFAVESIFQIPGLGRLFVSAAFNRDYTMVLGTVLFYAVLITLMNLLADLLQAWLDPRLRPD